jgi:invasion protein IalB
MNRWVLIASIVGAFILAGVGVFLLLPQSGTDKSEQQITDLNAATQPELDAAAQPAQPPASDSAKTQSASTGPGWAVSCKSQTKDKEGVCRISQAVVLKNSGRVLTNVTLRVPGDAKPSVILIRLPLGLYLPAGATYQIDQNTPQALNIRACVRTGCYAQTPVAPDVLAALKAGKQLTIGFQNLAQKPIKVLLSLDGFGVAYDKIQKPS